jgi:acetyl-CoA carboxylase/biotin carboxylase 1
VNLPATQLNIAMGIPLYSIPCIRKLYGKDAFGVDPIDFNTTPRIPPNGHVIACRITAENPEEGFKPTSGHIQELTFRSTPHVWGYFSVQGLGGLHEFADSQFGHLFAWGNERDTARKNMAVALKELSIRGDIRTPVEYLVKILETETFISLTNLHTGWLDEMISKPIPNQEKLDPTVAVICGATWKAYQASKARHDSYMGYIERGQTPPAELLVVS